MPAEDEECESKRERNTAALGKWASSRRCLHRHHLHGTARRDTDERQRAVRVQDRQVQVAMRCAGLARTGDEEVGEGSAWMAFEVAPKHTQARNETQSLHFDLYLAQAGKCGPLSQDSRSQVMSPYREWQRECKFASESLPETTEAALTGQTCNQRSAAQTVAGRAGKKSKRLSRVYSDSQCFANSGTN